MSVSLHLGDCLKIMQSLPDKSVDCFMCDLPYGQLSSKKASKPVVNLTTGKEMSLKTYDGNCDWDIKIDIVEFWKQVKRLSRDDHTPVLMFCTVKFGNELINSNPSWFRYDLVWNKGGGAGFLNSSKQPLRQHEMVYVFCKKGPKYFRKDVYDPDKGFDNPDRSSKGPVKTNCYGSGRKTPLVETNYMQSKYRCVGSVISFGKNDNKKDKHPTEKPVALYRWLLERYCPPGGTVVDPTAGSFNSVFVAKALGMHGIGMEMDRGFFYRAVAKSMRPLVLPEIATPPTNAS
jgi:site-specific DNA-methyltransferase (adenine-specific)